MVPRKQAQASTTRQLAYRFYHNIEAANGRDGVASREETVVKEADILRKRSRQIDWKCKMFSRVVLSGVIIGALSYDHFDNVT